MWHHYQKLSACLSACSEGYTGKKYTLDFSYPWLKFYNQSCHLCVYSVFVCNFIERIRPLNGTEVKDKLFIVTFYSCLYRVAHIVEWKMTLVLHLPLLYPVGEVVDKCLLALRRLVNQDVCINFICIALQGFPSLQCRHIFAVTSTVSPTWNVCLIALLNF